MGRVAAPIERGERNLALDALRGFALLGILLMNIVGFALHRSAYDIPTLSGGAGGRNVVAWAVMHVLAEGKMRCLFSLVFGAGVILLTSRLEARAPGEAADVYYRRMLWLLVFGVLHAYLLWWGDILYPYALCGLVLYPLRRLSARALAALAVAVLLATAAAYAHYAFQRRELFERGQQARRVLQQGGRLTPEQDRALGRLEGWREWNRPFPAELERDAARWRGPALEVLAARADVVWGRHSVPFYDPGNGDVWSMMLLGMALMKARVLGAERALRFYVRLALVGYASGLALNGYTAWRIVASGFSPVAQGFANVLADPGRLSMALGHLGALLALVKSGRLRPLVACLAAVGRTAFSNYILQSLIGAFVFTGYGLALYGRLERYQLYYVVAAIWVLEVIASLLWLRFFRFGPLEWLWRSLTYWKPQPLRAAAGAPPA